MKGTSRIATCSSHLQKDTITSLFPLLTARKDSQPGATKEHSSTQTQRASTGKEKELVLEKTNSKENHSHHLQMLSTCLKHISRNETSLLRWVRERKQRLLHLPMQIQPQRANIRALRYRGWTPWFLPPLPNARHGFDLPRQKSSLTPEHPNETRVVTAEVSLFETCQGPKSRKAERGGETQQYPCPSHGSVRCAARLQERASTRADSGAALAEPVAAAKVTFQVELCSSCLIQE